jgi:hypothetical protein
MPGPRMIVPPPTFVDRPYGLWSVVEDRSAQVAESHWRNGVKWQDLCGIGGSTYDPFCLQTSPDTKAANITTPNYAATPFVAFAEVDCSPIGYTSTEHEERASAALTRIESWQVERIFATGMAGGDANIAYPHLAATTAVTDLTETTTITLQCATTTVTGSTLLDVTEGIGRLEAALASCLNGRGVIHVPYILGEQLFRANAVKANGPQLQTQAGHLVALGAGYPGTGPDGTATPNAVWLYATGPVFGYRSTAERFRFVDSLDRSENTARMIAERTYVLGYSCCCLYAVLVSVGGIVTGQPLSAF